MFQEDNIMKKDLVLISMKTGGSKRNIYINYFFINSIMKSYCVFEDKYAHINLHQSFILSKYSVYVINGLNLEINFLIKKNKNYVLEINLDNNT